MDWKKFFMPDVRKIILFLFVVFFILIPIAFIRAGVGMPDPLGDFVHDYFIIHVILWYIVSCLSVYAYEKFKARKK